MTTQQLWYQKNKERILAKQKIRWNNPKVRTRHYELVAARKVKLKKDLVAHAGGKCLHCGYKKYIGALEFHHLGKKRFKVGDAPSRKEAFHEIKQCILLCSNCHRELHSQN